MIKYTKGFDFAKSKTFAMLLLNFILFIYKIYRKNIFVKKFLTSWNTSAYNVSKQLILLVKKFKSLASTSRKFFSQWIVNSSLFNQSSLTWLTSTYTFFSLKLFKLGVSKLKFENFLKNLLQMIKIGTNGMKVVITSIIAVM